MGSNQSNVSVPLWDPVTQKQLSTYAEFNDDWFEQGASRLAYKGAYRVGQKDGQQCVVKLYKKEYQTKLGEPAIQADARSSMKSKELADRFNFEIHTNKPIHFLIPTIAKVEKSACFNLFWLFPLYNNVKGKLPGTTEPSNIMLPSGTMLAVEDFLFGEWDKFLSNGSWVNVADVMYGPPAFAHYTYHVTGQLLVCDLQGVRESARYLLTDPAIHDSVNGPNFYGPTDLGAAGIVRFFAGHTCNDICRRFRRPDVKAVLMEHHILQQAVQLIMPRRSTTYTYELEEGGVILSSLKGIQLPMIQE